ncbi:MAG: GntR family transcriptional regulator [Clostridiales Family XIII bacterium]|nr:GntR family transcriptional regulator [Clostridiales Family XIII bacterium]
MLHIQLGNIIRNTILSNHLQENDALPTEQFLSAHFMVGRSTVRKALESLIEEGYITRVQGKGTFVAKGKMERKVERIYSFSGEIKASGLVPSSKLISITLDYPDEFIKGILTVKEDEKVYCIKRLRLANDEPLLLETTYVPFSFIGVLSNRALETGSLYDMLDDAGIEPYLATESYEAVLLKPQVAELLECKKNSPGFRIERRTTVKEGDTYEYTRSYMRGDRSKLVVTLGMDKVGIKKRIE